MKEITQILSAIEAGDPKASEDLLPLVYGKLRQLASKLLNQEAGGQTLQTTALVHEAYLRLRGTGAPLQWDSRGHFYVAAAESMRRILIENARRKMALKRGGGRIRVTVELGHISGPMKDEQLLALDEALQLLAQKDPRKAKLVNLRFFAGLTMKQASVVLAISLATAERDWAYAKAWLYQKVSHDESSFECDP